MTNPRDKTPPWKLSYIRKALRLRNALTDKRLIARLQVSRSVISRAQGMRP